MIPIDNGEAYESISWILDNSDMGFFIVTAPAPMQRGIAELYSSAGAAVLDFAQNEGPFYGADLVAWAKSCGDTKVLFVINMQSALLEDKDMLSFNMNRDVLAGERKTWLFFMTEELEYRLSTFAYDIYSYVRLKVHFKPEAASDNANQATRVESEAASDNANQATQKPDGAFDVKGVRESLRRYSKLEKQLMALSTEKAPGNQILSAALTLTNIAQLYMDCADFDDALRLLERVRQMRESVLGEEHSDIAAVYNSIALAYSGKQDYSEALAWSIKAGEMYKKTLGKQHPITAGACENIVNIRRSLTC